jgi:type IV pilus assembly protein PilM
LAEAAGLTPVVVDVESYASRLAAGRLIENLPNKGAGLIVALFEVGALTTSMQVLRDDEVLYDRDQAFGGAQLTQLIVRQYGFSQEEAESKKRSGELPEDYESSVLRPFILLYQHAAQQGRLHHVGGRVGRFAGSDNGGNPAHHLSMQSAQSL